MKGSPPSAAQTERAVFPHSAFMNGLTRSERKGLSETRRTTHVSTRLPNGPHSHNPGVRSNWSSLGRVSPGQWNNSGLQIEIIRKGFLKCS